MSRFPSIRRAVWRRGWLARCLPKKLSESNSLLLGEKQFLRSRNFCL